MSYLKTSAIYLTERDLFILQVLISEEIKELFLTALSEL